MRAIVVDAHVIAEGQDVTAIFHLARWARSSESAQRLLEDNVEGRLKSLLENAPETLRHRGLVPAGTCEAFRGAAARAVRRAPDLFTGQVVECVPDDEGDHYTLDAIRADEDPYATCGAEEGAEPMG